MVRGVLFDMDGLMFDTEVLGLEGWKTAGRKLGIELTDEMIATFRGMGNRERREQFIKLTGRPDLYDEAVAVRVSYSDSWIARNGVPVKPGLKDLLDFLKMEGIPAALATSTERGKAEGYLREAGVEEYFAASVCGAEAGRSKPAPDIFLKAAGKLGTPAAECMVLEDSENGIRAARAAGCMVTAVPDLSPAPAEELGLWDWCVDSLPDVKDLIRSLNGAKACTQGRE